MYTEWNEVSKNDTDDNTDENKFTTKVTPQTVSRITDAMSNSTTSTGKTQTFGIFEDLFWKSLTKNNNVRLFCFVV